jgi:hypothetical protein
MEMEMRKLEACRPKVVEEEEEEEVYEYKPFSWRTFFLTPKYIRGSFACLEINTANKIQHGI